MATGTSVTACEQEYTKLLANKGVTQPEELPQTTAQGTVAEIRSAVLEGNTYYFVRLDGEEVFYSLSAAKNELAVILNVGDKVTIEHAATEEGGSILDGYSLTIDGRAASNQADTGENTAQPAA